MCFGENEMRLRFAPSPTGLLHIGNARTALLCYLCSQSYNGELILRIDDTDQERSKQEFVLSLKEDLEWLGIEFTNVVHQSSRFARYEEIIEEWKQNGTLYPCYETKDELELKKKMLLKRGLPPIYDREALRLSDKEIDRYEKEGRKQYWRFKLDTNDDISWVDGVRGKVSFVTKNLSDPVIIRENGVPTYMLPSTIDDVDMDITHIFRGEDHITNTAIQIQMMKMLGAHIPEFMHVSLLQISSGGKISKSAGGFDLSAFRKNGMESMAIASYLAKVGTSDAISIAHSMRKLVQDFSVEKLGKSRIIFEEDEIRNLNMRYLQSISYEKIQEREQKIGIKFWNAIKGNLQIFDDFKIWYDVCYSEIAIIKVEDKELLRVALEVIPETVWDESTWDIWISNIKDRIDRSGKKLFLPIRMAITAQNSGPELGDMLYLIGKEKVISRLQQCIEL